MKKLSKFAGFACLAFIASIAYAASSTASGSGPAMTARGTAYILTLSPSGAPAADTAATVMAWSWTANPGQCLSPVSGLGGGPSTSPCPMPAGFRVRLCWHTDADGMFWINPNTPTQCKDVTNQPSGSTMQWQGWVFNSGAKKLRMKLVFSASGSGSIAPAVTTTGRVTINW